MLRTRHLLPLLLGLVVLIGVVDNLAAIWSIPESSPPPAPALAAAPALPAQSVAGRLVADELEPDGIESLERQLVELDRAEHEPALAGSKPAAEPVDGPPEQASAQSVLASYEEAAPGEAAPAEDLGTYIAVVRIDLASPMHAVTLEWAGPEADARPTGPFHCSPGAGLGYNDCNDVAESNRNNSNCTPKGKFVVQGFSDQLPSYEFCRHVTWIETSRGIAIHSHYQVPRYPASHGCVRMYEPDAKLIHDNARVGVTVVQIGGTWRRR